MIEINKEEKYCMSSGAHDLVQEPATWRYELIRTSGPYMLYYCDDCKVQYIKNGSPKHRYTPI